MDKSAFLAAYEQLNTKQKEVVDSIEGPVLVIAGPGTGKTQILTLRIANILLKTDTKPENILALTFTESGAQAMRERLHRYIGSAAFRVPLFTFHGFAQYLIGQYPDAYERIIGGRPVTDIEKIRFIEEILTSADISRLRPMGNPSFYVSPIERAIATLKQEYVTPDTFAKRIDEQIKQLASIDKIHSKGAHKGKVRSEYTKLEEQIAKNQELLFVYRRYEACLRDRSRYDFEDMIIETVEVLKRNESVLRDVQERYQYILADEHQDVNGAQNEILERIASFHESPNIFAVGDEKQAIYRFQGASLENFLQFTSHYPTTKVISLNENYRSGQPILDVATDLMKTDDENLSKLRVPLQAVVTSATSPSYTTFSHQAIEDAWLVSEITNLIKGKHEAQEIAVVVRTNREVEQLATLLRKNSIPVSASAETDILSHPITVAVMSLLKAVARPMDTRALWEIIQSAYLGITLTDVTRVFSKQSFDLSLLRIITDENILNEIGVSDISPFIRLKTIFEKVKVKQQNEAPQRVLEFLITESGLLDQVINYDPIEGTRVIRRLYDEVESMVHTDGIKTLAEIVTALETRQTYHLPLRAPYIAVSTDSVRVMTAHKAKGLEFKTVFVPHLTDSSWSGSGAKQYFNLPLTRRAPIVADVIEDERRLLYVAMTRAKNKLILSSAKMSTEGRPLSPARLLLEINEGFIVTGESDNFESSFNPASTLKPVSINYLDYKQFIEVLKVRGLSATSLNNYLRNPWDFVFKNILRLPEPQSLSLQFGTAIHNTLETLVAESNGVRTLPNTSRIKSVLESELRSLPVTIEEYTQLLEKGISALVVYIAHVWPTIPEQVKTEFKISAALETGVPEIPVLPLTGKIDRIDFNTKGQAVCVVDYKTGKPKTRNVIEGKTKDSNGDYKRQLVFYALLLSLSEDDRLACREGKLSFVEADSKGIIHEEAYVVTDEEIEDLKQGIISLVQEFVSGDILFDEAVIKNSEYSQIAEELAVRLQNK